MLSVACRWIEIELNHVESGLDHERLLIKCLLRLWIMFQSEFICLEYYKGMLQWLYYYQMLVAVFNLPKRVLKVQGFFVLSSLMTEWNWKYWWVEQFFEIERRLCFRREKIFLTIHIGNYLLRPYKISHYIHKQLNEHFLMFFCVLTTDSYMVVCVAKRNSVCIVIQQCTARNSKSQPGPSCSEVDRR